jgi:hypothetical protein
MRERIKEEVKRMKELTGFKLEWILERLSIRFKLHSIGGLAEKKLLKIPLMFIL